MASGPRTMTKTIPTSFILTALGHIISYAQSVSCLTLFVGNLIFPKDCFQVLVDQHYPLDNLANPFIELNSGSLSLLTSWSVLKIKFYRPYLSLYLNKHC